MEDTILKFKRGHFKTWEVVDLYDRKPVEETKLKINQPRGRK